MNHGKGANVLIFSSDYPPRVSAGVGAHVHQLAVGLVQSGWNPTVISAGRCAENVTEEEGVRVIRAPLYDEGATGLTFKGEVLTALCRQELTKRPFVLAHFHEPVAIDTINSLHEMGIPILLTQHSTFTTDIERFRRGAVAGASPSPVMLELCDRNRRCLQVADAVICVSRNAVAELRLSGVSLPPIRIICNGVDVNYFAKIDHREAAQLKLKFSGARGRLVLFAGRACGSKGFAELLMARSLVHRTIPEAHFVFLLGNLTQQSLASSGLSDFLGSGATFLSNVTQEQMPTYYAAADIVVMPSRSECFGMVAIEAMAAGRPLVVSDVEPLNSMVTDGVNGRIVPRTGGNAEAVDVFQLAEAICELLRKSPFALDEMGRIGRERVVSKYSAAQMVELTSAAYRDLIGGVWSREVDLSCSK